MEHIDEADAVHFLRPERSTGGRVRTRHTSSPLTTLAYVFLSFNKGSKVTLPRIYHSLYGLILVF
ncbi:MAG: hypothetical protein WAM95_23330 [Bacillus sp. (in: firmicutes)]